MSQRSIERLRDYLVQLPPQAQALLMREFERAIERGEDTSVAALVLEQLRQITRGPEDGGRRRSGESARLLYRPLEPFLVGGNAPTRPGQIRRASLMPVWEWLARDGAPELVREYEAALERSSYSETSHEPEAFVRRLRLAAASAIFNIASPAPGGDKQRALVRVGPPDVIDDLLPIATVFQAREALDTLSGRLPRYIQVFSDSQIAAVSASLNVATLQTPQMLPFALWLIIRLAIKMAASDDEVRVTATPYGIAVTIALHDLACLAATLRMDFRRGHFANIAENLKTLHDGVRGLRTELDLRN